MSRRCFRNAAGPRSTCRMRRRSCVRAIGCSRSCVKPRRACAHSGTTTPPLRTTLATSRSSAISQTGSVRRRSAAPSSPPISISSAACSGRTFMCSSIPICASCGRDSRVTPFRSIATPITGRARTALGGGAVHRHGPRLRLAGRRRLACRAGFRLPLRSAGEHRGCDRIAAAQAGLCLCAAVARSGARGPRRADVGDSGSGVDFRPFAGAWRRRQSWRSYPRLQRHPGGGSLAPVQLDRGVHKDYFVPLCSSPISRSADRYRARNEQAGARPAETGK